MEPSSDPMLLFTPPRELEPASTDRPELPVASSPARLPSLSPEFSSEFEEEEKISQRAYVELRSLTTRKRKLYRNLADIQVGSDDDIEDRKMERVVGDYNDGNELFYFVRSTDGITHKYIASLFRAMNPDLVQDYRRRKEEDTLSDFDPSGPTVHPSSRVKMVLKLGKWPKSVSSRRTRASSDDPLALRMNSDYSNDTPAPSTRKSTRAAAAGANKSIIRSLPFSPKKTRSSRSFVVPDSDEDSSGSDVQEVPARTRKSTRTSKKIRSNLDDAYEDDGEDEVSDEDSDGYVDSTIRSKGKGKKKKVVRGRASRPAYGRFRMVADLDYDNQNDEETAALRAHRDVCEKCHKKPTHELLNEPKRGRKKGRKNADEDLDEFEGTEEERTKALGGWVRCLKCPVSAHWGCLASNQRAEILKAALDRDKTEWFKSQAGVGEGSSNIALEPVKRDGLDVYQTTEFICGSCMKGGFCMICLDIAVKPDVPVESTDGDKQISLAQNQPSEDVVMADGTSGKIAPVRQIGEDEDDEKTPTQLLFRCFTCKRLAHYDHLPVPDDKFAFPDPRDAYLPEIAEYYQRTCGWKCSDCFSFVYSVEHILAWRPYPENAVEPVRPVGEPPNHKSSLPREYLIKWVDRSYRRAQWVPHMWLLGTHASKLKNFLTNGSKVALLPEAVSEEKGDDDETTATFDIVGAELEDASTKPQDNQVFALHAEPDALRKIPPAWKTVDRVLDVLLWRPDARLGSSRKSNKKGKGKQKRRDSDDDEVDDSDVLAVQEEREAAFGFGEQLAVDLTETVAQYEDRTRTKLNESDASKVVWAFLKWDDLGYDDASWDTPPRKGEPGYAAFEKAFKRFVAARRVVVKIYSLGDQKTLDDRAKNGYKAKYWLKPNTQPDIGQSSQLKLLPFQVDGVNWLCDNWWNHQNCILADEMGLGKTVQVVTFLGYAMREWKAFPALVVVPNSTITNWVREFERWAPALRVVPFYGESKAREIIKRYELYHPSLAKNTTGAKYHVLITTYETITNPKEFTPVFKNTPRWEMLVVDEGQRLKNDESLIFKKLKELRTFHRVIMTGTPLNNNIRELFNLMNFLDPEKWRDLDALARDHEELTEESIKQLHTKLKPYFLRRIKSEVLHLPPKNEVIIPVSMVRLQKTVYASIIKHNLDILRTLARGSTDTTRTNAPIGKTNMNNILMQLRKCLQHPYLVSTDIEPKGLSPLESHAKLIDGSAKLVLLKTLLPRLQARGHRVLLFSQFVMALDIVEDFLNGERMKFLRLDGNTKQSDRQKGMDEFNKPGSDVFIYLLTTRAGGVGINLWSADTVIIFDPDFNPHQDLQAIARSHRYGQTKTCLVFKLMVQNSAEEKIMQTGKKKLVLDHLIVQKMDDDEGSKEDVQSILMYGAEKVIKEVEADEEGAQIHYSEQDIDNLIERTEKDGDQLKPQEDGVALSFSFAKVWSAEKDDLEDMADDAKTVSQVDSWAQTLERLAAERAKDQAKEQTGRGVRRRAAAVFPKPQNVDLEDSPRGSKKTHKGKGKAKSKETVSDDSDAYAGSPIESDSDGTDQVTPLLKDDIPSLPRSSSPPPAQQPVPLGHSSIATKLSPHPRTSQPKVPTASSQPLSPILNRPQPVQDNATDALCGLCGLQHGNAACYMTEDPKNLAEFRYMLIMHAGDEPVEERLAAIDAIDRTLYERGKIDLIYDQPLCLVVDSPLENAPLPPAKKHKKDHTTISLQDSSVARTAGSSAPIVGPSNPRPVPRPSIGTNAVAGSSKRPLSPDRGPSTPKRKKGDSDPTCAVCRQSPHLIKDCPAVAEGPGRVVAEIKRLENDPAQTQTVNVLRHLLPKLQRRALASSHLSSS